MPARPDPNQQKKAVVGVFDLDASHKQKKMRGWLRVWASLKKGRKRVIEELFEEAQAWDPEHRKEWVDLFHGLKHPLDLVKAEAKRRGIHLVMILDLMHVLGYLWAAAFALRGREGHCAQVQVKTWLAVLLRGKASRFAAAAIWSKTEWNGREPVGLWLVPKRCSNFGQFGATTTLTKPGTSTLLVKPGGTMRCSTNQNSTSSRCPPTASQARCVAYVEKEPHPSRIVAGVNFCTE